MIVSVTTAKMTGLDLGPPPIRVEAGEDSLTTPKVEPIAPSSPAVTRSAEDMLTTPVLTTPKTAEVVWGKDVVVPLSPTSIVPVPPPRELPMDSDIGLRSPCDGLLHKRRMFKNKINNSGNSLNSDSNNSCDTTPCSADNSPRDLSLSSSIKEEREDEELCRLRSPGINNPSSSIRRSISKPSSSVSEGAKQNLMNFQQSPLAVPSPNWNVVERYIGVEILKTPKLLDNSFFDFLVPPSTPKNGGKVRDISPGSEADRYSGRDQRLSPRLSPRFPIPEAPTDLSKNGGEETSYEAEDLSMSKQNTSRSTTTTNRSSPSPSPPSNVQEQATQQKHSSPPPSCKTEYSSSSPGHQVAGVPEPAPIKTEMENSTGGLYEYRGAPNSFPHHLYFPPQFHSALYHRQIYSELQGNRAQMENYDYRQAAQHQMAALHSHPHQNNNNSHHTTQIHHHHTTPPHHHSNSLHWSQHMSAASHHHHQWTIPTNNNNNNEDSAMEEDESSSPPYGKAGPISVKPPSALLHNNSSGPPDPDHHPAKKSSSTPLKKRGAPKDSAAKSPRPEKNPRSKDGLKRTYVCPHCQRSYDWNYNLNRHLKYECGKENAFQCAKCSRKFPHKQNCVYHLKRKHKIICDSIDQYVSKGFVIFQGAAGSSSPTSSSGGLDHQQHHREGIPTS